MYSNMSFVLGFSSLKEAEKENFYFFEDENGARILHKDFSLKEINEQLLLATHEIFHKLGWKIMSFKIMDDYTRFEVKTEYGLRYICSLTINDNYHDGFCDLSEECFPYVNLTEDFDTGILNAENERGFNSQLIFTEDFVAKKNICIAAIKKFCPAFRAAKQMMIMKNY